MADGEIRIKVTVNGKDMDATVEGLDKMQSSGKKAAGGIKEMVTALGLVKVASAAINVLANSLGDAIKRFDTIERYPKVMESLGYGADVSKASIDKLSKGIEGLPTTLDSVVASTQKMTTITGSLGKSTDAVLALNNSFMANGASVADAERGMIQYVQMLSKGTVDVMSWRTLQETMGVALKKTAEAMGYLGSNGVNQLYSALQSGEVTFSKFQDNLVSIATGTGEIAQLAQQNSVGIATSFINLRTAIARNLADIVKIFDDMSKAITGKTIAENIEGLKESIESSFTVIKGALKKSTPAFKVFVDIVKWTISVVKKLSPVLLGAAAAYAGFKIISKVNGLIVKSNALIATAKKSTKGLHDITLLYTTAAAKKAIAESSNIAVTKAQIAVQASQNGVIGLGTAAIGLLTTATTMHELATIAATIATTAFKAAITFLTGPLGIVVSVIGLLVGGAFALKSGMDKAAESTDYLDEETKKLIETSKESTEKIKESTEARKSEIEEIEANTEAYMMLADELEGLMKKEDKSASDKARIEAITKSLSSSVEDLGLAYDKEKGSLSMGTGHLKARIKAMQESNKLAAAQKGLAGITRDLTESEKTLTELKKQRADIEKEAFKVSEANSMSEIGTMSESITFSENKKKKLEDVNVAIKEQTKEYESLKSQSETTNNTITTSQAAVDEAISTGVLGQISAYENLSTSQKEAIDSMNSKWQEYQEQATNMFSAISQDASISVDELIGNLSKNQTALDQWGTNMETLRNRLKELGLSDAVITQFEEMGVQSGLTLDTVVKGSDEKLKELDGALSQGGKTAISSFGKTFNLKESGVTEEIAGFMTETKETLSQEIANADFAGTAKKMGEDVVSGVAESGESVKEAGKAMGKSLPDGLVQGVNGGVIAAGSAVDTMAKTVANKPKIAWGIGSKESVFTGYGKTITGNLKDGITQNKDLAPNAIQGVATEVPKPFDPVPAEFTKIGSSLMDVLARSIRNNTGVAVSAAQEAAGKVKAAIQGVGNVRSMSAPGLASPRVVSAEGSVDSPIGVMAVTPQAVNLPAITAERAIGAGFGGNRVFNRSASSHAKDTGNNDEVLRAIYKLSNRPIAVSVKTEAREIVKAVAVPMENYLDKSQKFKDMLRGVRAT